MTYDVDLDFADGRHTMHVHYVPDRDGRGGVRGFFTLVTDITEEKRAKERLLQSQRLAAIGETVTGLAHESRNALQRSQAGIERLVRRLKDDEEALEILHQIQKAQDDLHRIYEEVREYAIPIGLDRERCDLAAIVLEAWEDLRPMRQGRRCTLRQEAGELDLHCIVDRSHFLRVIRNILENSLVATQEAGEPLEIQVRYRGTRMNDDPALSMALLDNGPGLSPEARERIFDAFYTTRTRGTGLGMAIAKRIVEAHGGEIRVGKPQGPGTEIVITLPRRTE